MERRLQNSLWALGAALTAALLLGSLRPAQDPAPRLASPSAGNADVVARLVGKQLAQSLGQPVVVEIKSGAGGRIASDSVAKARPDGYTLVMLTGAHTVSAALSRTLPYDPVRDFSFLSTVSKFPFVLAVRADHPAKTLADLLAMAAQVAFTGCHTASGFGEDMQDAGQSIQDKANK